MWPWQHKNRVWDEQLLWRRVLQISVISHIIFIFSLFFVTRDEIMRVSVLQIPTNARIVCLPSFALPQQRIVWAGSGTKGNGTRRATGISRGKSVPLHKTAFISSAKQAALRKKKNKLSAAAQKKLDKQKKVLAQRAAKEHNVKKRDIAPVAPPQSLAAQQVHENTASQESVTEGSGSDETIVYVDQTTFQASVVAQELQTAIAQWWAPPAGMSDAISCDIKVVVTKTGIAGQATVVQKSGVAVYDMAARSALLQTQYPKTVWNRTIIVHFG